jgi:hypothetical protein
VYGDRARVAVVAAATSTPPHGAATWTHQAIAEGGAATRIGRILADLDLEPHKVTGWPTHRDTPEFWERAKDICDLYRHSAEGAVVLSIDEKTVIATRSRKHSGRPAAPRQELARPSSPA